MPKIRGSQKGLTMIEVLVSLMIFLVVLLAIYQLFDTSHATYASGTKKQDVQQQARLAMDEIVKRVRMAGYFPENFTATPVVPALANRIRIGAATGLAVYGDMDQTAASKIFLFCFDGTAIRTTPPGAVSAVNDVNSYTCNQGEVLADNITGLSFQYFDAANNAARPVARWAGAERHPRHDHTHRAGFRPDGRHHAHRAGSGHPSESPGVHLDFDREASKCQLKRNDPCSAGGEHLLGGNRGRSSSSPCFSWCSSPCSGLPCSPWRPPSMAWHTMGIWSEGALHAADAGVNRGLNQLNANAQTSIQAIANTGIGLVYRYRSGRRTDNAPQPLQFVGSRTEAGYSIAVGTGYNPSGYAFHAYQINATGTGPRNARREVEIQAEYGPVAQ